MNRILIALSAAAAICLATAPAASAANGSFSIKSGTDAATAGKCLANIVMFTKISEEVLKKESPENKQMSDAWIAYVLAGDDAFATAATNALGATTERYSAAMKNDSDTFVDVLATDLAECLTHVK